MRRMYEWLSIPELADRLQIRTIEASAILKTLGLRWRDDYNEIHLRPDIFDQGIAREKPAPVDPFVIEAPRKFAPAVQWNWLAIHAMLNHTYPADGWAAYVEQVAFTDLTRHIPF